MAYRRPRDVEDRLARVGVWRGAASPSTAACRARRGDHRLPGSTSGASGFPLRAARGLPARGDRLGGRQSAAENARRDWASRQWPRARKRRIRMRIHVRIFRCARAASQMRSASACVRKPLRIGHTMASIEGSGVPDRRWRARHAPMERPACVRDRPALPADAGDDAALHGGGKSLVLLDAGCLDAAVCSRWSRFWRADPRRRCPTGTRDW